MVLEFGLLKSYCGKRIISYNFYDIADGIGYKSYYGATANNGTHVLVPNKINSESITTQLKETQLSTYDYIKKFDLDFDLTFSVPKNIRGDCYIGVPMGVRSRFGSVRQIGYYVTVNVYHYDGSTETLIGTGTSKVIASRVITSDANENSNDANNFLIKAEIATIKHFKPGETLRFTIEGYFKILTGAEGYGNYDVAIGHDPRNRENHHLHEGDSRVIILGNGNVTPLTDVNSTYYLQGIKWRYISTQMEFMVPFDIKEK